MRQETQTQTPTLPFEYTISPAALCFSKHPPSHMPLSTKIEHFNLQGFGRPKKKPEEVFHVRDCLPGMEKLFLFLLKSTICWCYTIRPHSRCIFGLQVRWTSPNCCLQRQEEHGRATCRSTGSSLPASLPASAVREKALRGCLGDLLKYTINLAANF